jgi:hypothetical protein
LSDVVGSQTETKGAGEPSPPIDTPIILAEVKPRRKPPQRGKAGGRTRHKAVWLTEAEEGLLAARAAEAGLSIASYLRAAALGDAGPRARRAPTIEKQALGDAIAELNKIGSNINQIARAANIGKEIDEAFLHHCLDAMRPVLTALLRAINA